MNTSRAIAITVQMLESTRTTFVASFLVVLFAIMYVYLLNETIMEVVGRKRAESEAANLSTRISELEFQYISLQSGLDIDHARSLGFREIEQPTFASRDTKTVLSMSTER